MPTPADILAGLQFLANAAFPLAVAWHAALLVGVVALVAGWRPSRRLAGGLLVSPLVSVSALAFTHQNPFNGGLFALLAISLLAIAARLPRDAATAGPRWAAIAGACLIGFGWLYPHFLEARPAFAYLYGAPTGLIPCPTLSVVIGFALLAGGFGSRPWSLILSAGGLFYGIFGVVRLGVYLDLGLMAGAGTLLALGARRPAACPSSRGRRHGPA